MSKVAFSTALVMSGSAMAFSGSLMLGKYLCSRINVP
jgi:hypothetical protein